jgi:TRAP transporter 4TM/12TM fusion protein
MADVEVTRTAPPSSPVVQTVTRFLAGGMTLAAIAWSADLYREVGIVMLLEQFLAPMLGTALALVFINFPLKRKTERTEVPWYDWIAASIGLLAGIYASIVFSDLQGRLSENPLDALIISVTFVLLSLEGLRRTTGYALLTIVCIFIGYSQIGHLVKGDLETLEVKWNFYTSYIALDSSGLLGLPMVVATTIVIAFVFFGQLLSRSGGAMVFNELSLALMGRFRGGSAKIAITASSLFGSISGVAVSNIVATGIITIPMMKKSGYSSRLAASVEAVASTGGQLMPPVMGAVAFLMADFLELPYSSIVVAALVPALLYYVALFIQADLEAAKEGIDRVPEEDIPELWEVVKKGWLYFLPFAVLIFALFNLNWRAEAAAMLASVVTLALGFLVGYKGQRLSVREVGGALVATGKSVLDIMMIVAGAGFIIGSLQVTGLGFAFTVLIVELAGQSLFILLLVAGGLSIILGMGMPTVSVYILLALLVAPSLVEVGVQPIAAHMFILYLGMMSLITPPVAVAAFFAASIAKAPPMATAWTCMRFGWTAYVVPFLFVFSPSLLLQGNTIDLIIDVSSAIAGVWLLSASLIGYFAKLMEWRGRFLFFLAGALLFIPAGMASWAFWTDWFGAGLGIVLVFWDVKAARRLKIAV